MRTTAGRAVAQSVRFALAVTLMCALAAAAAHATPTTPEIQAKQAEARSAQEQLNELAAVAELRAEEHAQMSLALEETKSEIVSARDDLDAADDRLAILQERLENRVGSMYRYGSIHVLEVLLGTNSFTDFLTRVEWLRRVGDSDATLIANVRAARDEVINAERVLSRRSEEQSALRAQAAAKLREVDAALERQEQFVTNLNAGIAHLIAEEEGRLRREAEERALRAAEEAALRAAALASNTPSRSAIRNDRVFDPDALGSGHPQSVVVGVGYLGVPYVWGGATPTGFDCSGLVQYVYREIGVSLPRTSREQFRVGAYIPPDRLELLRPGDLVFFGYGGDPSRVHHVGIYVGGEDFLHAPRRGQPVQVESLMSRILTRADYVGATRP